MSRLARSRPSPSMIVAMIALFVALGGASYAAVAINSVGSKQLKKNAVTTKKIKNNAVTAEKIKGGAVTGEKVLDGSLSKGDFATNQVPTGPAGATGKAGPEGPPGTAAFARVDATGALIGGPTQSKGIQALDIQHSGGASAAEVAGTGVYCFGGLDFTPTSAIVSLDNTDAMPAAPALTGGSLNFIPSVAIFKGEDLGYCDNAHNQARVAIEQVNDTAAPALANHGFFIWFEGE